MRTTRGRRRWPAVVLVPALLLGVGLALGGVPGAAPEQAAERPAPAPSPSPEPGTEEPRPAPTPSPAPAAAVVRHLPEAPIRGRGGASAVWTGEEMIVWGGTFGDELRPEDAAVPTIAWQNAADGAAYHLDDGTWRTIAAAPLEGRSSHVAVWTGREMLVWGGHAHDGDGQPTDRDDGAAYAPATDTWRPLPPGPVPGIGGAAVWTGRELVLVGGYDAEGLRVLQGVMAYAPSSDSWRVLPDLPLPGYFAMSAHGVGGHVVVVAQERTVEGASSQGRMRAAALDPTTEEWRALPDLALDPGPHAATVVATDLVVTAIDEAALGAVGEDPRPPQGLPRTRRLDGGAGEWTDVAEPPHGDDETVGLIGLDEQVLAVMGEHEADDGEHAAVLELDAGGWTPVPAWPTPRRRLPAMTSTGAEVLVWGGRDTTFDGPGLADGFVVHAHRTNPMARSGGR